jgi:hypothetical protein
MTNQIQAYKDVIAYLFNHKRFYTSDEISLAVEHPVAFLKACRDEDGRPYVLDASRVHDLADSLEKKWMSRWDAKPDDAELLGDINVLLKESLYITAIKIFRCATGASLIESKNAVEKIQGKNEMPSKMGGL